MSVAELPVFLRPCLRLFLSVDLVGSTSLKQGGRFPIKAVTGKEELRQVGAQWFFDMADFYGEIPAKFTKYWNEYADRAKHFPKSRSVSWPVGEAPELWKSNGDELIFVKELESSTECAATVSCWIKACREYRKKLKAKESRLDIKMAAWTAGFPISNTEVIFPKQLSEEAKEHGDQHPEVLHYFLLDEWHTKKDERPNLVRDYIGPGIDTGFRIASKATARKFTICLELAYILSHVSPVEGLEKIAIQYDGETELKGVLGGKPYPLFWIDTMHDDALTSHSDKLLGVTGLGRRLIKGFCKEFVAQHDSFMLSPFIKKPAEKRISAGPRHYEELLEHIARKWSEAKKSHEVFLRRGREPTDGDDTPPSTEILNLRV